MTTKQDTTTKTTTVALIGATGRVGGWVLEGLLEAEEGLYHVKALTRSADKLAAYRENVTIVEGDATNQASLEELLTGADVFISTIGSPGKDHLVVEATAINVFEVWNKQSKAGHNMRGIWMTSTGINEATEQAKMYSLWGAPNKSFFGYGLFGWLVFKLLIPYVIGQDLWDDMAKSEQVIRNEEQNKELCAKTVLVRPTNMHPVSEHAVFSEEWRKDGGTNLDYHFIDASDPPIGKWMVRRAIAKALIDLIHDDSHDGTAVSLFQKGTAE